MPGPAGRKPLEEELRRGRQAFYRRLTADASDAAARLETAYQGRLAGINRAIAQWQESAGADERALRGLETLKDTLARELDDLQSAVIDTSAQLQARGAEQGVRAGLAALERGGVTTAFHLPTVETIQAGIGYVDSTAWRAAVSRLGAYHAEQAADLVLDAIARGQNPRQTARYLREYFTKSRRPMVDALRMARTTQLYAAREGTRQIYQRTGVEQWIWSTNLGSPKTCFPAGTLVMTEHGEKPVEAVRAGEKVLTHTGKLRTVKATMKRMYRGGGVSLLTSAGKVTMTDDHPVLVERGGELYWITAEKCRIGDVVFIHRDYLPDGVQHRVGNGTIKRRIRHADDAIAAPDQSLHLGRVGLLPVAVPVRAVNFDSEVQAGQVEVNWIFGERRFLQKFLANFHKAKAEVLFRLGFAGESPVARDATKLLVSERGHDTKALAAILTGEIEGRAAAFLGAIGAIGSRLGIEKRAAPLARQALNTGVAAFVATKSGSLRMVAIRSGKLLAAPLAGHKNRLAGKSLLALATAKAPGASPRMLEALTALLTGVDSSHVLSSAPALVGAVAPTTAPRPGVRNDERLPANFTDFFCHVRIIAHLAEEIHEEVFNLEVEDDHTFVANGLVVHNCLACIALHGTVHPVSEILADHHQGRCSPTPVTPKWAELGFTSGRDVAIETGVDWFVKQPADRQAAMMGPQFYEAWTAGAFRLEQVPRLYHNDIFGPMYRRSTLAELLAG